MKEFAAADVRSFVSISNATAERDFTVNQYVWYLIALSDKDRNAMMSYDPDVNRGNSIERDLCKKTKQPKHMAMSTCDDRFLMF